MQPICLAELTWPNLLFHRLTFSDWTVIQVRLSPYIESKSLTYMFFTLSVVITTLLEVILVSIHWSTTNLTSFPWSHICETLRKLVAHIIHTIYEDFVDLPMSPTPKMSPPFPITKWHTPTWCTSNERKFWLSTVMCFEQLLSIYHHWLLPLFCTRITYRNSVDMEF